MSELTLCAQAPLVPASLPNPYPDQTATPPVQWMPAGQHLSAPDYHRAQTSSTMGTQDDPFGDPGAQGGYHTNEDLPLLNSGGPPGMRMRFDGGLDPNIVGPVGAGMEEPMNVHFGRIPQRQPRRYKTVKRVECVRIPHAAESSSLIASAGSTMATSCLTVLCLRSCSRCVSTRQTGR